MRSLTDKLVTTIIIGICLLSNACKEQNTEAKVTNSEIISEQPSIIPKETDTPAYIFNTGDTPRYQDIIDAALSEEDLARRNKFLESETEEDKLEREINSAPELIRYSNLK